MSAHATEYPAEDPGSDSPYYHKDDYCGYGSDRPLNHECYHGHERHLYINNHHMITAFIAHNAPFREKPNVLLCRAGHRNDRKHGVLSPASARTKC
jgi:hypothetical protein